MPSFIDLTGQTFGQWTVISRAPNDGRRVAWNCSCACGTARAVLAQTLRCGESQCCGCVGDAAFGARNVKHGGARREGRTLTYVAWGNIIQRCTNPRNKVYRYYGGRGITVCQRWRSFENFLADMGEKPDGLTIDRIDNDGNYEPGNCRWTTMAVQNANKRGQFPSDAARIDAPPGPAGDARQRCNVPPPAASDT